MRPESRIAEGLTCHTTSLMRNSSLGPKQAGTTRSCVLEIVALKHYWGNPNKRRNVKKYGHFKGTQHSLIWRACSARFLCAIFCLIQVFVLAVRLYFRYLA